MDTLLHRLQALQAAAQAATAAATAAPRPRNSEPKTPGALR
jgi:hypothetical protein